MSVRFLKQLEIVLLPIGKSQADDLSVFEVYHAKIMDMNDKLLELLAYELGEILCWEEECPGVYYLGVRPEDGAGREYYAVFEDAPVSQEVRAMGRRLESVPALV